MGGGQQIEKVDKTNNNNKKNYVDIKSLLK